MARFLHFSMALYTVVSQTQKSIEKLGNDGSSFDYIWETSSIFNIWRAGKYRKSTSCNLCPLFEECGGYQ